ncbi:unnamed protein product, partial [Rotaria socialis]
EFFYATDYANGPMIDDSNYEITASPDLPTSVPHCSNNPGLDTRWESVDTDYSLPTPRRWISNNN